MFYKKKELDKLVQVFLANISVLCITTSGRYTSIEIVSEMIPLVSQACIHVIIFILHPKSIPSLIQRINSSSDYFNKLFNSTTSLLNCNIVLVTKVSF